MQDDSHFFSIITPLQIAMLSVLVNEANVRLLQNCSLEEIADVLRQLAESLSKDECFRVGTSLVGNLGESQGDD